MTHTDDRRGARDGSDALVSIVTPAYNAVRFLGETITSVQSQTYPQWELIVADDASRDETMELVSSRAEGDSRIRWTRLESNSGPGTARNHAVGMARGRFLAFLDADDLWDPGKLEAQLGFMTSHGYAFSYADYRVIDERGSLRGHVRTPDRQDYPDMLKDTVVGCLTVMIDRKRAGEVVFPPYRIDEDRATWLSVLSRGLTARRIPVELASYRIVRGSSTRNKIRSAAAVWKVLRDHEQLGVGASVWYFMNYAYNGTARAIRARTL